MQRASFLVIIRKKNEIIWAHRKFVLFLHTNDKERTIPTSTGLFPKSNARGQDGAAIQQPLRTVGGSDTECPVYRQAFKDYPTAEAMANATPEVLYEYVRSVSYPNSKAKHLSEMARILHNEYQGVVPSDLKELMKLPGVGRKTANVIQSVVFQKATMAVDTHVFRVSHRIGLVPDSCRTPLSVERMLTKHFPKEVIPQAHHWLILHGRYVCTARSPKCEECGILHICARKFGEFKK